MLANLSLAFMVIFGSVYVKNKSKKAFVATGIFGLWFLMFYTLGM